MAHGGAAVGRCWACGFLNADRPSGLLAGGIVLPTPVVQGMFELNSQLVAATWGTWALAAAVKLLSEQDLRWLSLLALFAAAGASGGACRPTMGGGAGDPGDF